MVNNKETVIVTLGPLYTMAHEIVRALETHLKTIP